MASATDEHRCLPCEDGRKLLIAAAAARIAWALACGRFSGGEETAPLASWAAIAVSSIAPVLAYRLAINLRLSRAAGLIAGALIVVHPGLVDAASRPSWEAAWPTLSSALLVAWVYAWQSGGDKAAALAGLFAGTLAWAGVPAAIVAAAVLWPPAAFVLRAQQPRWKTVLAAACIVGALAAAPSRPLRPVPPAPLSTEWSAPVAVTPAVGPGSRVVRTLFFAALFFLSLFGLARVSRGPGGFFALAWLAAVGVSRLSPGSGPAPASDPALAVLAATGADLLRAQLTAAP